MKRRIGNKIAFLGVFALSLANSTSAAAQRDTATYNACIQGCIAAAQEYGWNESPYWAGYSACAQACNEYNPEPGVPGPGARYCLIPGELCGPNPQQ